MIRLSKLIPCPYCKKQPRYSRELWEPINQIMCANEACKVMPITGDYFDMEYLREAWNKKDYLTTKDSEINKTLRIRYSSMVVKLETMEDIEDRVSHGRLITSSFDVESFLSGFSHAVDLFRYFQGEHKIGANYNPKKIKSLINDYLEDYKAKHPRHLSVRKMRDKHGQQAGTRSENREEIDCSKRFEEDVE